LSLATQISTKNYPTQMRWNKRQRDGEIERQRDRETERQRDRETERQRDRETERQRDRETERKKKKYTNAICPLEWEGERHTCHRKKNCKKENPDRKKDRTRNDKRQKK
jgi:hypothetical protein